MHENGPGEKRGILILVGEDPDLLDQNRDRKGTYKLPLAHVLREFQVISNRFVKHAGEIIRLTS